MFCSKCGGKNNENSFFCVSCGNALSHNNVNQGQATQPQQPIEQVQQPVYQQPMGQPMHQQPLYNQMPNIESGEKSSRKKDITSIIIFVVGIFVLTFILLFINGIITGTGIDTETTPSWVSPMPFFIFLVVFSIMYSKTLKEDMNRLTKKNLKFIAIMSVVTLAVNIGLNYIISALEITVANQDAVTDAFTASMLLSGLSMVIAAPVVEEIVFRKALNGIVKNTPWFLIISAVFFGIMHYSGIATLMYIAIGFLLALVYIKTDKNVVAAIVVHFVNNALAILLLLLTL